MPKNNHAPPKTERERRMRWVQMQRVAAGEIDTPGTRYPTTPEQRAAARKRVCEVLALEAGLPLPDWTRLERGKAEPIDVAAIKAAWDHLQHDRRDRYAAHDIALEKRGSRARCKRCGEMLMDVPHGLVGVTPTALHVMHAKEKGCC